MMTSLVYFTLFGVLIGLLTLEDIDALSWKRKPTDKAIPKGGNVKFFCEVNDRANKVVIWNRGSTLISSNNQVTSFFQDRYSIEGEFNLVIRGVEENDNEQFTCNVLDLGSAPARLTILLPPNPPIIKRNFTGNPYKEKQVVKFTCESMGGNPVPTMKWFKNGQEILNIVNNPSTVIGGLSSCETIVTLDSTDHQANYSCIVSNAANKNSPLTASTLLQVQYSPFITFGPYNPYNIQLGHNAQLECTVDANPPVSTVNWRKNGQPMSNHDKTLLFRPVRKSDSGNYTCICSNGVGGSKQATGTLNAIYAPDISVPGSKTFRESEKINIECVVDANPEPREIKWEKVSGNQSTTIPYGSNLVINSANRHDAGNYTCIAMNQLRISGQHNQQMIRQAFTYVHIQYGPGEAFISPVSDVDVGKPLQIKCSARPDGYPAATYEWKKDNSVLKQTSSTYSIINASLKDNGVYTCTPINTVSHGASKSINVNVNQIPNFVVRPARERTLSVSHTETLSISCKAKGRPPPEIDWYKENSNRTITSLLPEFYELDSKDVTVEKYTTEVTSTLVFKGPGRVVDMKRNTALRIDDMGVYHCKVKSAFYPEPITASQIVNLQFKPVVTTDEVRIAVNLSLPAQLPCTAQAFPIPQFQWYRKGKEMLDQSGRFSIEESVIDGISRYHSILKIDDVSQADLGFYHCFVSNNLGNVSQPVHLTIKTVPESPRNLRSSHQTWESIELVWDEGFNGGFRQQYTVKYRTGGEERLINVTPPSSISYNLTKLRPQTTYSFIVFGKNRLGNGEMSRELIAQTAALSIPSVGPSVDFNVQSGELIIENEVNDKYCVRVTVKYKNKGDKWDIVYQCLEFVGKKVELRESNLAAMNLSVCLKDRHDVCGKPVSASLSEEGEASLTAQDVYIIGSVCGVIIFTLLVILVIFICRRRRNHAKYEENKSAERRTQPVNGVQQPPVKQQVYDNQGMSHIPGVDMDDPIPPSAPVYSLSYPDSSSNHTNFSNSYGPLDLKHNHGNGYLPNGHVTANGTVPHDTSYDSQIDKRMFENEMNRRNEHVTRVDYNNRQGGGDLHFHGIPNSPSKDKYVDLDEKKEGSLQSTAESGYSTPDPNKPKKVIYEVVV